MSTKTLTEVCQVFPLDYVDYIAGLLYWEDASADASELWRNHTAACKSNSRRLREFRLCLVCRAYQTIRRRPACVTVRVQFDITQEMHNTRTNIISVARIFRGWVRPGVDPGFLVRGGTMEGPKAPTEARSADGGGVWRGAP